MQWKICNQKKNTVKMDSFHFTSFLVWTFDFFDENTQTCIHNCCRSKPNWILSSFVINGSLIVIRRNGMISFSHWLRSMLNISGMIISQPIFMAANFISVMIFHIWMGGRRRCCMNLCLRIIYAGIWMVPRMYLRQL